jgi:hypothetical protein
MPDRDRRTEGRRTDAYLLVGLQLIIGGFLLAG